MAGEGLSCGFKVSPLVLVEFDEDAGTVMERAYRWREYERYVKGKKDLTAAEREWQRANDILARFSDLGKEPA